MTTQMTFWERIRAKSMPHSAARKKLLNNRRSSTQSYYKNQLTMVRDDIHRLWNPLRVINAISSIHKSNVSELDRYTRYRANHREKLRQKSRRYYKKNRPVILAKLRDRFANDPNYRERKKKIFRNSYYKNHDKKKLIARNYYSKNRLKRLEKSREYRQKNPHKFVNYSIKYQREHPEKHREKNRRYREKKKRLRDLKRTSVIAIASLNVMNRL